MRVCHGVHPGRVNRYYSDIEQDDATTSDEIDPADEKIKTDESEMILRSVNKVKFIVMKPDDDEITVNFSKKEKDERVKERYNLILAKTEEAEESSVILVAELPAQEHGEKEVVEANERAINNLESYDVFDRVEDNGQPQVGSRWAVT